MARLFVSEFQISSSTALPAATLTTADVVDRSPSQLNMPAAYVGPNFELARTSVPSVVFLNRSCLDPLSPVTSDDANRAITYRVLPAATVYFAFDGDFQALAFWLLKNMNTRYLPL